MVILILFYLGLAAIMLVPLLGVRLLAKRLPEPLALFVLVAMSTLLLTPSWGPATITVVLVPFGLLFGISVLTWSLGDLWELVRMFPVWHAVAFPVTAVLAYLVVRKLPSSYSFKPTPSARLN